MTKTQLKKWLENKLEEAITEINSQYREAVKKYEISRDEKIKLSETAHAISELMLGASKIADNFLEEVSSVNGLKLNPGYYGSFSSKISSICTECSCKDALLREFTDCTKERIALSEKKNEMERKVTESYTTVIANVTNMKNAKVAVEYLQELGFDLSDLLKADVKPVITALATEIDTRYLFIGGKADGNKQNG